MKPVNSMPAPATRYSFTKKYFVFFLVAVFLLIALIYYPGLLNSAVVKPGNVNTTELTGTVSKPRPADLKLYKEKMLHIINGDSSGRWVVNDKVPGEGAVLPYKRIIAFYGNLYSKQMGILGELPKPEVLQKLQEEAKNWEKADPEMTVQPALHYIAVTAQNLPGKAGKYRLRMPFSQIDSIIAMAEKIGAIIFLDIQVGLGSLQEEIPEFEKYLSLPNIHLGIDPEFSMKGGQKPGAVIGEFNDSDINYATNYLAEIVRKYNLPPKILVVHRFTQGMVKNYKKINVLPEVQIVMHMDGWGIPAKKIGTYKHFISKEPVEYTGFKIFYKNDTRENSRLLTPAEILQLKPQPLYIQYQ